MLKYTGDVEWLELLYTARGTENWHNYFGKQIGVIFSQIYAYSTPKYVSNKKWVNILTKWNI